VQSSKWTKKKHSGFHHRREWTKKGGRRKKKKEDGQWRLRGDGNFVCCKPWKCETNKNIKNCPEGNKKCGGEPETQGKKQKGAGKGQARGETKAEDKEE